MPLAAALSMPGAAQQTSAHDSWSPGKTWSICPFYIQPANSASNVGCGIDHGPPCCNHLEVG
jgi:hypothetical protein